MNITFQSILGKYMIIGITYLNKKGNIIKREQFYGKVIISDERRGIVIRREKTGEELEFPPILDSIEKAKPGEYTLISTGEVIMNPDLLSTWIIEQRRYNV